MTISTCPDVGFVHQWAKLKGWNATKEDKPKLHYKLQSLFAQFIILLLVKLVKEGPFARV